MEFFSSVPLVDGKNCPDNEDHNRLASQVNARLTRSGPDCLWRVFYYADSIFSGMRNTATPGIPLGVQPPEDEWWKVYMTIEYPVSATGVGNWPLSLAGTPQGANVMNPLNAYIFGRKTAENKILEKMGPWAEGNIFDGLVASSKAVLTNKQFWEDAFMQRGAISRNKSFDSTDTSPWEGYGWLGRKIDAKYLPNPKDPVFLSNSLTSAAVSSDRYFEEYASNHIYMRHAPAIQGGRFISYGQPKNAPDGVLKRKNAAKDLLQWGLWCYVYYFRGSEAQRSLFCSSKPWSAKTIDYEATGEYKKSLNIKKTETRGPLNICKVGFDFYKYFTRQNVFAPAVGIPRSLSGGYKDLTDTGNVKLEPYRVSFGVSVDHANGEDEIEKSAETMFCSTLKDGISVVNYDTIKKGLGLLGGEGSSDDFYGKSILFESGKYLKMVCNYSNYSGGTNQGDEILDFSDISGKGKSNYIKSCLAGYYLETDAIENPRMAFKFQILSGGKVVHETLINSTYSYKVARNRAGKKAYIYNKVFYFKEGIVSNQIKFRILPVKEEGESKVISIGNPWSESVNAEDSIDLEIESSNAIQAMFIPSTKTGDEDTLQIRGLDRNDKAHYPSHLLVDNHISTFAKLEDGDLVRVKSIRKKKRDEKEIQSDLDHGDTLFIRRLGADRIFFVRRQDDRLKYEGQETKTVDGETVTFISLEQGMANPYAKLAEDKDDKYKKDYLKLVIEKLNPPSEIFKAKVDLAILQKRKPSFRDAYALFRAVTAKQNSASTDDSSTTIFGDAPGVGVVGHHFEESQRVFQNYFKYGSAMNIYGSSVVPALRMYVSANPVYESMRKFISSYMRFADRRQLVNYTVEGGTGVLYFKRFAWGPQKRSRATILRNMEPSIEPAGWFAQDDRNETDPGSSKFIPIQKNKKYKVACGKNNSVVYEGTTYYHGGEFQGNDKDHLDSVNLSSEKTQGAFELNGITSYGGSRVSNEWIMFMTSSHYHWANTNIYKPDIYNDVMGFLNNRCHHRSKEYEDNSGDKYDMIRSELLRIPTSPSNTPGRLAVFLSKSSPNFNYIFNTNDPEQGNLDLYSETGNGREDYLRSCPAVTPRPYKVTKTEVVNSRGNKSGFNPSSKRISDRGLPPFEIVKVTLNRRLRGTGRLSVGSRGWAGVSHSQLKKEPYRTDENAIIEYLHHLAGGHSCKRNMIGDYGSSSDVVEGDGYRPFGACYPRFYFLKLVPKVPSGALLSSEPYAQMDFYFRAMGSAFINPFPVSSSSQQTTSLSWKHSEIASRSSEEDPTKFDYIDPREITS